MIRSVIAVVLALAAPAAAVAAGGVTITGGPEGDTVVTSPTFTFAAPESGGFECSLDAAAFTPCSSPDTVGPLALGPHTFAVRMASGPGAPAADGAAAQWTVVAPVATPVLTLSSPEGPHLRRAALRTISGTAVAPSGVRRVQIALYRGRPDKSYFPPACHFVALDTGQAILQPCLLPPYVTAHGSTRWRYTVPAAVRRHVRKGAYHLVVRALNSYDDATRHDFALTVR